MAILVTTHYLDPAGVARGIRVGTDDASAPAAMAMRSTRAEIVSLSDDDFTALLTVPLRGCRRALGTIVFEGVRVETGGELDLLDRADELGRQLSSAIENMQLLDDVMRSRRELENTFDSISHLVAVSDTRGHIVHVNQAFATRVGQKRDELLDRPLADHRRPGARRSGSADTSRATAAAAGRIGGDVRDRRPGAEGAVHGDGHRPAQPGSRAGRQRPRRARPDAADAARGRARGAAEAADADRRSSRRSASSSPASRTS